MHAMDDPLPVLEEPEFNDIDFWAVMILSKVLKVSHVCKCLAGPKHPSFECLRLSDHLIFPCKETNPCTNHLVLFPLYQSGRKRNGFVGSLSFNY